MSTFHPAPRFVGPLLTAVLATTGCAALMQRAPDAPSGAPAAAATTVPQENKVVQSPVVPLPGALDSTMVFNSNSPEIVTQPGVLLSTRPAANAAEKAAYLDYGFSGTFQIFAHHIAKDEAPGARLLYTGLVAENRTDKPVRIQILRGSSYLSQPDALFKPLDPIVEDPFGQVYAGPGDRVSTDWAHNHSNMAGKTILVPARGSALVYSLPIPTDVAILPPINGRTTQLEVKADGAVSLSEVAVFAQKNGTGFVTPTEADYKRTLDAKILAGPRDIAPVEYDPTLPPQPGRFIYGRVAGVQQGAYWRGILPATVPGSMSFPIATAHMNRLGTNQVQTAKLIRRYGDTAYAAHGNYGVIYDLKLPLDNESARPRTVELTLSQPAKVDGQAPKTQLTYVDPPNKLVSFRGTIRVVYRESGKQDQVRFVHVVSRNGEVMAPFIKLTVPPRTQAEASLTMLYPADATPPQLLTVSRSPLPQ